MNLRRDDAQPISILVVEDSQADFLLLQRRLNKDGLACTATRVDTAEQLEQALQQAPDIVLYDYEVPGLEFSQALALINAADEYLPIILVSGTVNEAMAVNLLRHGLTDFLLKDNLTRLASAINRALSEVDDRRARLAAEDDLRKLARVVEQSPAGILITDIEPIIEYVNEALVRTTGYTRQELIGQNPSMLNAGHTPRETYHELWTTLTRGEVWRGEFHNTRKDGTTYIGSATLAPIRRPDGTITHYVGITEDISAQREAEKMIEQLAYFDSLTGLPNRSLLFKRLGTVMTTSRRTRSHAAVIVLDIDGFKFINDIQSYAVGDELLRELAQRLQECVDDDAIIARVGGDQFALIVEHQGRDERAATVRVRDLAEKIQTRLDQPYALSSNAHGLRHSTSMGICVFLGNESSSDSLLGKAEIALQNAKEDGHNLFRFFSNDLQTAVEARSAMEAGLREALANDELRIDLQSQFDRTGRLIGAEALLRWQPPTGEMIAPDQFIPLAEATGLIMPIGQQVIDRSCRQLRRWQQSPDTRELTLSINISARQFHQPNFTDQIRDALKRHQVEPGRLKLELTESVVFDDLDMTLEKMKQIRTLGVGLALDDFGTGYSSLSYLKNLPFDQLKIDRSFVGDMTTNASSGAIVRAVLAMGHALGLEVVAEGVETPEQFAILSAEGCQGFQGYLLARPMPMEQWQLTKFTPSTPVQNTG